MVNFRHCLVNITGLDLTSPISQAQGIVLDAHGHEQRTAPGEACIVVPNSEQLRFFLIENSCNLPYMLFIPRDSGVDSLPLYTKREHSHLGSMGCTMVFY